MQLGFLGFEVKDLGAWTWFLTDILGTVPVGGGKFRIDGHTWRLAVTEGDLDDVSVVGWELDDDAALDAALARLAEAGVPVSELDASVREAQRRYGFTDPAGIPTELVVGMARTDAPLNSPVNPRGFVADEQGLGHVVLTTKDKAESVAFYTKVLGIRLSDHIITEYFGHDVDLSFFHVNARHHSVAFGGPQRHRINHFMLECRSMDDVGLAYDRCIRGGIRIFQTLGRHPNDRMFSFYARSPSGFQFEYGWGGREVDDDTWTPTTYDHISEWGHHPPQVAFARPKS